MSKPPHVGQVGSWLAAGSEAAFKATFAMLLIVAALGTTYTGSDGNFPLVELGGVLVRVLAFSGLLLVVALVLRRERVISNAALALATLTGLFTAYVVHTELFHPSNRVWMVLVLVAALFALFTAFRVIDELRWGGIAFAAAAFVAAVVAWPDIAPVFDGGLSAPGGLLYVGNPVMWIVLVLACIGAALALFGAFRIWHPSRAGGIAFLAAASLLTMAIHVIGLKFDESGSGYYGEGWEDHPNVRSVAFDETPNIYFVSFDSITPEAVMRKHMGIETTAFHRLMAREMRRFRNLFANAVPTRFSLNTLMALDQDIYLEATGRRPTEKPRGYRPSYFAGHDLSPLIWLLRLNGYETTSIYQTSFFGRSHGPHIDNYVVNDNRRSLCALLDPDIRVLAFWGHCWGSLDVQNAGDFLVQELSSIDKSSPQVVIAHLNLPGHTPHIFDYHNKDDRGRFLVAFERRFNSAATYLAQIIDHLGTNDPDAILYVYGDHGAWLSRGMNVEDDPTFFLQDRFGILGGVYPRDRCAPELNEAERKGYMTSLDVVHAILRCVSGGQSPILEPRRDRFWTPAMPEGHSYDYKDYLYE